MKVKIYAIRNGDHLPYIGHTTQTLKARLGNHREFKRNWDNEGSNFRRNKRCASYYIIDGNETIELLEEFEGETKQQILDREQYWIDTIPNCNINRATGRKDRSEYFANYRETHKEEAHAKYLERYKTKMIERNRNRREMRKWLLDFNL